MVKAGEAAWIKEMAAADSEVRLFEILASGLKETIDSSGAGVFMLDEAGVSLLGVVGTPTEVLPETKTIRISMDDESSATVAAVKSNACVRIEDTFEDPGAKKWLAHVYRIRAAMAIPITINNRAIGAAMVVDTREPRKFTEAECQAGLRLTGACAKRLRRLNPDKKNSFLKAVEKFLKKS